MLYFHLSWITVITISFLANSCKSVQKITFIPYAFQYDLSKEVKENHDQERSRRALINAKKREIDHMWKISKLPILKSRSLTNDFLGAHVIHAVYEAKNVEAHPFCSVGKITRARNYYHSFRKTKELGEGAQGVVYKITSPEGHYREAVMKTYNFNGDFVMQVNAQYAMNRLIPSFQLLGVLKSVDEGKHAMLDLGYMYEVLGTYCMITEHISGLQITDRRLYRDMLRWRSRAKIRFIISLLRQLQALHFSYNHYEIFPQTPSFIDYTFTLFHGDLHSDNFIITRNGDPRLIDIGAPIWKVLRDYGMIMLMQYNYHLLKENIGIEDRKRHVVHKKSLMNHLQANDFCKIFILLLEIVADRNLGQNLRNICKEMGEFFLQKGKLRDVPKGPLIRLHKYYGSSPLWFLIPMVLRTSQPFREYQDSWLVFYKYLYE